MAEQHDKILLVMGLTKDQIKKLNDLTADELKDLKENEFTTPVMETLQTKFLNDNEFLKKLTPDKLPDTITKPLEANQYGRLMTEMRLIAKNELGLNLDDYSDEELGSLKKFFKRANHDYVTLKAPNPKTINELQKQLADALKAKETSEQEIQTKITEALKGEKEKHMSSVEKLLMKNYLSNLKGYELKANPDYILDTVLSKVKSKFAPVVNDDNTIALNQKENPQLKVLKSDGTDKTLEEALVEILSADGMVTKLEQQQGGDEGKNGMQKIIINGNEQKMIPDYIARQINSNIEVEKNAKI